MTEQEPFLDLYLAVIPGSPDCLPVLPEERQAFIDASRNAQVKAQRCTAWVTLLTGIRNSTGLGAQEAGLYRDANGKWTSDVCGVSISHCSTAVAAAVSSLPVGIDLEPAEDGRYREALLTRIATDAERERFSTLPPERRIAVLWTRKEASFKRRGEKAFSPIREDAASEEIVSLSVRLDREYVVSVASDVKRIRVFAVEDCEITERADYETIAPAKPDKPYVVYILRCAGDRLYTGITTDLSRRFSEHGGSARGAKFTRAFRPEGVAAAWETDSRANALKLEACVKKLRRGQKDALIEKNTFDAFKDAVDPDAYRRLEV